MNNPSWSKTAAASVAEMLREQVEYRELLATIVRRDLMLRYKQTVMGFGWALFMPLLNTIIFSVIFMRVAPVETPVPYPVFAFCGLAAWNFFASALRFAVSSLTSNPSLVTKVYFPREIFPFSAVLVALVDFAVASTMLVVHDGLLRHRPELDAALRARSWSSCTSSSRPAWRCCCRWATCSTAT